MSAATSGGYGPAGGPGPARGSRRRDSGDDVQVGMPAQPAVVGHPQVDAAEGPVWPRYRAPTTMTGRFPRRASRTG